MYEIDFARGFAYEGNRGFIVEVDARGVPYIIDQSKQIFLTAYNTKVMEEKGEKDEGFK